MGNAIDAGLEVCEVNIVQAVGVAEKLTTQSLYDNDGYMVMVIPAIRPDPIPLSVTNCRGVKLECTDRNYWRNAWHVVDARPGITRGGRVRKVDNIPVKVDNARAVG